MKILVIRFSSIGDIVLTSPVVRCLKNQRPETEIHYLTKAQFGPILSGNPYIDRLHFLQPDLGALIGQLRQERFDQVIDLHHNLRSLRIANGLSCPSHRFSKLNLDKWLMVRFKWNRLPDHSIVDRYFGTVRHLGVTNDGLGLDYFIPQDDQVAPEELPGSHRQGYIALVIGGAHPTKKMPREMLRELCRKLEEPVLLLGGAEDRGDGDFIREADPSRIFNGCGNFRINQSADLVAKSRLVITHDTGLMHIAAAFKKQVISIWGNTVPEFGMFPYYGNNSLLKLDPRSDLIEVRPLYCRPCSKIGYDKCPKGHFRCMRDIDLNQIAEKAKARLAKG